jgi:hypothetical protein
MSVDEVANDEQHVPVLNEDDQHVPVDETFMNEPQKSNAPLIPVKKSLTCLYYQTIIKKQNSHTMSSIFQDVPIKNDDQYVAEDEVVNDPHISDSPFNSVLTLLTC